MASTKSEQNTSIHGPYEDLAIALIDLIKTVIEGQPSEVRAELWKMYLEDMHNWREFGKGFGNIFKRENKE